MTLGTDRELVERCLREDRAAWAELLGRYADLVHGLLHRTGLDGAGCADGFQEVSILLWKNLRRLEDAERLLPWIATTTRRVGWRLRKRASARTARQAAVARVDRDPGPAPDESLAGLEEEQAVREAMAALTERCRRLLVALYFGATETSYEAVAQRLGLPRGSIGPTRRRCLEAMRKELAARGVGEGVSDASPEVSSPVDRPTGVRRGGPRRGTP